MKNDGMKIEEAMNIKPKDIADYLGGLPSTQIPCSILADKPSKKAVENYRNSRANINFRTKERIIKKIIKIKHEQIRLKRS